MAFVALYESIVIGLQALLCATIVSCRRNQPLHGALQSTNGPKESLPRLSPPKIFQNSSALM